MNTENLYNNKTNGYYENIRDDIISLIPDGSNKILEVGCGKGYTLRKLKAIGKADKIIGIEINENSIQETKKYLDNILFGNIEEINFLPYDKNYFDVIIFADVLEHLVNPWKVLKMIRHYLNDRGFIIATIPNMRHKSIILPLVLKGIFQYNQEGGAMDISHLRFFTRRSVLSLFKNSGYSKVHFIDYPLSIKANIATSLSFGLLRDFFIFKFRVMVEK